VNFFIGDASEVYHLAADLSGVTAKMVPALRAGMQGAGEAFADQWRSNAEATSGEHGVHYPASISAELVFDVGGVSVDVGPESGKPQGGMSFEFGSRNQPPHLDGLRAMTFVEPRVERIVDAAVTFP
jgi:hypothetical protein